MANSGVLIRDGNGQPVQYPSGFSMQSGGEAASVNSAVLTSNVARIYTDVQSYAVGQKVQITLIPVPAEFTLTDVAVSSNVATFHTSGNHGYSAGDNASVTFDIIRSIIGISSTGSLTTFTTSAVHGFKVGDTVEVYFEDDETEAWKQVYNGSHVITAVTSTTFKVALNTQVYIFHDIVGFGTARVAVAETATVASASTNVFTMPLTRANFTTFSLGITVADIVSFSAAEIFSGTYSITGVENANAGTVDDSFTFALTHANVSHKLWTGVAIAYYESPLIDGSIEDTLIFPENAFRLRLRAYTHNIQLMIVSNAASGGYISIPYGSYFEIPGKPGDMVIISRDSGATPVDFIFDILGSPE